jgi:hypothetical protein
LLAGSAFGASAAPGHLSEAELKAAVGGKTVRIDTPLGLPLTVSYGANGIMTGTAGTVLAAYLGSARDRGRWSVRNGKLCQKWFKWLAGDETCMQIRQEGLKIHWRSDSGRTGLAMIETGPPELSGATASGLGLPMPPASDSPPAATTTHDDRERSARDVHAAEPQAPPPAAAAIHEPAHPAPPAPSLVEAPREVAPAPAAWATATAATVSLASLAPSPRSVPAAAAAPAPVTRPSADDEDASAAGALAIALPMRRAVDLAAVWSLEHRWCLADALGTGHARAGLGVSAEFAASGPPPTAPPLLVVAADQISPSELPLHAPSCLTPQPALAAIARLGTGRD